jgi:hypothetical protein
MEFLLGCVVLAACVASMWMARARNGEVIALLRSETAQTTFMMTWICVFILAIAFVVEGISK